MAISEKFLCLEFLNFCFYTQDSPYPVYNLPTKSTSLILCVYHVEICCVGTIWKENYFLPFKSHKVMKFKNQSAINKLMFLKMEALKNAVENLNDSL